MSSLILLYISARAVGCLIVRVAREIRLVVVVSAVADVRVVVVGFASLVMLLLLTLSHRQQILRQVVCQIPEVLERRFALQKIGTE